MRIVGFFLRTAIILMALIGFSTVIIAGLMFITLWTVLPPLVVMLFVSGLRSFIS